MDKAFASAAAAFVLLALGGCAGRPSGNLIPVSTSAPGAKSVDMLVATTRAEDLAPPGIMFSGERGRGLAFADIVVSIPPDAVRKVGEVQWPSSAPGDPAHDFVTLRADRLELRQAKAAFDQRVRATPKRHVLVFVHGYNTRFEEAVYRLAQIAHDSDAPVVPVLFTWPSRGKLLDYVYDRESATYSRDALEDGPAGNGQGSECRVDFDPRPFDGQFRRRRGAAANGDPQSRPPAQDQGHHARGARHRR